MLILIRAAAAVLLGVLAFVVSLAFLLKGDKGAAIAWGLFIGFLASSVCPPDEQLQIVIRVFTERD